MKHLGGGLAPTCQAIVCLSVSSKSANTMDFFITGANPAGHTIQFVPFAFFNVSFHYNFTCPDVSTILKKKREAMEGIQDKDYNLFGNDM